MSGWALAAPRRSEEYGLKADPTAADTGCDKDLRSKTVRSRTFDPVTAGRKRMKCSASSLGGSPTSLPTYLTSRNHCRYVAGNTVRWPPSANPSLQPCYWDFGSGSTLQPPEPHRAAAEGCRIARRIPCLNTERQVTMQSPPPSRDFFRASHSTAAREAASSALQENRR